ncbi:hypothetical protein CO015_01205 [candidate division WWE3 bacterium CG_4_8_14_3_um_filter_42_11]|uniref:Uncharacterized protein n=2 Tax=Katanobacteria TaxID=422282 RepID=A0A2M7WX77_UNCKA|nr:MAG: hypothetical protein CO181_02675 [candidate division WWE3 bacterium CG_4_9_14_3_um_filter_43_9]PJC69200.1 MAG: hypothetical protein CO015_01205 [candidate division WWE3 bacterium CG_4_8_14_3_um_filter_42_11]
MIFGLSHFKGNTMNKLTLYLITLSRVDYKKLLLNYLPEKMIDEEILLEFVRQIYSHTDDYEKGVILDPWEWLENEAELFCTPNPHCGFKANFKTKPGSLPSKKAT